MKSAKEAIKFVKEIASKNNCEVYSSHLPNLNKEKIICKLFIVHGKYCIYFNIIDDSDHGVRVDDPYGARVDQHEIEALIEYTLKTMF